MASFVEGLLVQGLESNGPQAGAPEAFVFKQGPVPTIIKIGDADVANFTRSLSIEAGVGQMSEVRVEMIGHRLDVELSARVVVQIVAQPGFELVCLTDEHGTRRFVSRRIGDAAPALLNLKRAIE